MKLKTATLSLILIGLSFSIGNAQTIEPNAEIVAQDVQESRFTRRTPPHTRAVLKVIKQIRETETLTRREKRQLNRLEFALRIPSFQKRAEDATVMQMYFSTSNDLEINPDGTIDRTSIDWDGLLAFLKEFIPILLDLLGRFGAV